MRTLGVAALAATLAAACAGAGALVARSGPDVSPAATAVPMAAAGPGSSAAPVGAGLRPARPDLPPAGAGAGPASSPVAPATAAVDPSSGMAPGRAGSPAEVPGDDPGVPGNGPPDARASAPRPRRSGPAVQERWIEPPDADGRGAASVTVASAPAAGTRVAAPSPAAMRGPGAGAEPAGVATIATLGTVAGAPNPPAPAGPEPPAAENPNPDPKPDPKPDAKPDAKPEPKPDPKPDPDPDPDPDPEPDPGDDTTSRGPTRVVLAPAPGPLAPGAELRVRVLLENGGGVASVPFHLHFDPRVLRFEQALQGPFMGSDGQAAIVMAAPLSSGDVVVVGAARLGAVPGISGSGEICSLQFRVVGPGATALTFAEAAVRAASGEVLPASFVATTVVVP